MKSKALLLVTMILSIGHFMHADEARLFRKYARKGQIAELTKLYEKNNALVHEVSACGQSALHLAAMVGQEDAVRFLMAKGANPLLRDKAGQTPFDFALSNGFSGIVDLLEEKGIEIIFDFKDRGKLTPELVTQWVWEDVKSNSRLRRAVNKARSLGLRHLVFTDKINGSAACSLTEIHINPFYESCSGFGADEFRERIRMDFCFELANMLNEDMKVTTEISSFKDPQSYADAVIMAEAKSFILAKELFTFLWTPNGETSCFFARSEALKDLTTYRGNHHYKKYVQQYLFHTIPGFKETVGYAITKAENAVKLFNELEAIFRKDSLSMEQIKTFIDGVVKHNASFNEYLLFLKHNREFLENTPGEILILDLFDTLRANDAKLQQYRLALLLRS